MNTLKNSRHFFIGFAMLIAMPVAGHAQYFISQHLKPEVLKASGRDSVLLVSSTPFEVPAINDTLSMTYHEPMPDSIMPRSAIVIGTVTVQAEDADNVAPMLEKYARKLGADWIVSFQEPKPVKTKDHWIVYRSTALLLRVLDDQFINQNNISYSYYEQGKLENYAAVSHWFNVYGKGYGAKFDQPKPVEQDTDK